MVRDFYDTLQKALAEPGAVVFEDFLAKCLTFAEIAGIYITVAVLLEFFGPPLRLPLADRYERLLHVLLASGTPHRGRGPARAGFMRSVMTLFAFLPLLWGLSEHVTELPWIGKVDHSLVYLAIVSAAAGTVLLAIVGIKLPGLEFNNQKVEAAYRKELVYGEDHEERAEPETVAELFANVRKNYFRLYKHYLYFDVAKWSYLQFGVIVPYIMMGPTIVAGIITLGVLQQILRAFDRVETSFQFLVNSWSIIVELISIYKRLKAFESQIKVGGPASGPGGPRPALEGARA